MINKTHENKIKKSKEVTKEFTFNVNEREMLQNVEVGMITAQATVDGLGFYKNALLASIYKRLGISEKPTEGYERSIKYTLSPNLITLIERSIEKPKEEPKTEEKK